VARLVNVRVIRREPDTTVSMSADDL
jgi:hypothetical protein